MARDQVRCVIAAAEGRVLNIGTEWSEGICDVHPGHLRFVPRIGIVGDRDIYPMALARMDFRSGPHMPTFEDAVWFRITTSEGDLTWGIPSAVVDWTLEKLELER